jgi:hypothetical protein
LVLIGLKLAHPPDVFLGALSQLDSISPAADVTPRFPLVTLLVFEVALYVVSVHPFIILALLDILVWLKFAFHLRSLASLLCQKPRDALLTLERGQLLE